MKTKAAYQDIALEINPFSGALHLTVGAYKETLPVENLLAIAAPALREYAKNKLAAESPLAGEP